MAERNNVVIQSEVIERPFTYQNKSFVNYGFTALVEGAETPVKFQTTSKGMAEIITKEGIGSKVELEYTTVVKGDFTNRKVTQVYKDGTALVAPKSSQGGGARSYGKTPEEQASIERQVDKKITGEIYGYHIEKGVPFNKKLLDEIFKAVRGLGKDLVEEAKKMGAVDAS